MIVASIAVASTFRKSARAVKWQKESDGPGRLRMLGLSAVLVDLVAARWACMPAIRLLIVSTFFVLVLWRVDWQASAAGLGRGSRLSWRAWFGLGIIAVLAGAGRLAYSKAATGVFAYGLPLESAARGLLDSVLIVPVLEEGVYRAMLCSILLAGIDRRVVIAASAVVFGILHLLYGQMLPEHLMWGAVLAWVYLKSGAVWLSVLLHAVGNLASAAVPVAVWYACGGQMWC